MTIFRPSTLKGILIFLLLISQAAVFSGCDAKGLQSNSEEAIVRVNRLKLTAEDLRREREDLQVGFAHEDLNGSQKPEWLNHLIEREVLVQEAQRLGLDRQDSFMRTIEKYWKAALIKQLLVIKSKEINSQTHVYEKDVEDYYQQLVAENKADPVSLGEMRGELQQIIREDKEDAAMQAWLEELKGQANVVVNKEALRKL